MQTENHIQIIQIEAGGFDHNFAYLLQDPETTETAVIDPCGDGSRILQELSRLPACKPRWILITHAHRDHLSGLDAVRKHFSAPLAAASKKLHPDLLLQDAMRIPFGHTCIEVLSVPGHTDDSVCFKINAPPALFTGDTLFIEDIGFCNATEMFQSLQQKILPLPGDLMIYPGHDYGSAPHATLKEIRIKNPYLQAAGKSFQDFLDQLQHLS